MAEEHVWWKEAPFAASHFFLPLIVSTRVIWFDRLTPPPEGSVHEGGDLIGLGSLSSLDFFWRTKTVSQL